jgi:hypothetical protein
MDAAFENYIGIDYSGAETPSTPLRGLRIYVATQLNAAQEIGPPPPQKYWTRRGIAEWLLTTLSSKTRTLVGIDHGFSFPLKYFERHGLPLDWPFFLDDFQKHWPTDDEHTYVDFVREGICGNGAARSGDSRWRRVTELRARTAKSVFHFDVPGQVAKSTHAGIPWLRYLRRTIDHPIHFWPFEGWTSPPNSSVVAEVYPALWSRTFPSTGRTQDQHDAFTTAEWLRRADAKGNLTGMFSPELEPLDRNAAAIEGWILGVA